MGTTILNFFDEAGVLAVEALRRAWVATRRVCRERACWWRTGHVYGPAMYAPVDGDVAYQCRACGRWTLVRRAE